MGCCSDPPPHLEHAPEPGVQDTEKRQCHDVLFLLLFIAFWVGMFYVASLAVQKGNPSRLLYGVDYEGNVCGTDNSQLRQQYPSKARDFRDKSYLYFLPGADGGNAVDICVGGCPQTTHFPPTNVDQLLCPYNVTPAMDNPNCFGTFASISAIHRCIPTFDNDNVTEDIQQEIYDALKIERATSESLKLISDLVRQWEYLAVAAGVAVIVAFVWLLLLRLFAGIIVWATILGTIGVIAALAYLVYNTEHNLKQFYIEHPLYAMLVSQQTTLKVLDAVFYILVIIDSIIVIVVVFMCNRIGIAIGLIKEGCKVVIRIPTILLVPIGVALAIVPLGVYWLWIGAYLATASTPEFDSAGNFVEYKSDPTLVYMQLYHLFGGFWTLNFLHAIGECAIAGAVASWYWVHDKHQVPSFPLLTSFKHIFRYHLGSLLFGSLILALVQFVRFILHQVQHRFGGERSKAADYAFKCVQCLLACFERFIKFLDKNAYIMVAIYGYSFCQGARRGFDLLASNILRVAALNCVTGFLIFLGKLFVCMVTTLAAFVVLSRADTNDETTYDYMLPVIAISILSYAIATAFFSVFDMAVDTLLLCFCEDSERNDGTEAKPYYMSNNLKHHMEHEHTCCGCC